MKSSVPEITLKVDTACENKLHTIASHSITLGRGTEAGHRLASLEDPSISRVHATLKYKAGRYWISDHSSLTGTWVNGRKLPQNVPRPLVTGDRLGMGETTFVVVDAPSPVRKYDVFLSHSSPDKPDVFKLGSRLASEGITCFLDMWDLRPGDLWQDKLRDALKGAAVVIFCLGAAEIGPWAGIEAQVAMNVLANDRQRFRIIPVLLSNCPKSTQQLDKLPAFFEVIHYVDLREGSQEEKIRLLIETIRAQLT